MESYCVHLTISLDIQVYAKDPDEAYLNAISITGAKFGKVFTDMTVLSASVTDESGSRVD